LAAAADEDGADNDVVSVFTLKQL